MANIRVGTLVFKIDGTQYALAGDFTLNPGVVRKEELIGPDGTIAFKHTYQAAVLEGTIRDRPDLDVKELLALEDVTITAELTNGKAWVLANATQTAEGSLDSAEGAIQIRFAAERAEELS